MVFAAATPARITSSAAAVTGSATCFRSRCSAWSATSTFAATPRARWSVRLLLEGAFQILTEWNLGELVLEPLLFRRAMLGLPPLPDLQRYREATRRASVVSSLSLTMLGGRLPEFWRQLFRQLAAPYDPPIVERVRV